MVFLEAPALFNNASSPRQEGDLGSSETSRYKTKMCDKILFDYVGQGKGKQAVGNNPPGWQGGRISRDLRGLFQPRVPLGFVLPRPLCLNYKPELNVVLFYLFIFQRGAPLEERDNLKYDFTRALLRPGDASAGFWRLLGGLCMVVQAQREPPQRTKGLLLVAPGG